MQRHTREREPHMALHGSHGLTFDSRITETDSKKAKSCWSASTKGKGSEVGGADTRRFNTWCPDETAMWKHKTSYKTCHTTHLSIRMDMKTHACDNFCPVRLVGTGRVASHFSLFSSHAASTRVQAVQGCLTHSLLSYIQMHPAAMG